MMNIDSDITHLGITNWLIHDDSDMTYFDMTDLDIDDQL